MQAWACCHSLCEVIYVSLLLCVEDKVFLEPSIAPAFPAFLHPIPHNSLNSEGKLLMKTPHLEKNVPKSLTLCVFPVVWLCVYSHLLQEKASLMKAVCCQPLELINLAHKLSSLTKDCSTPRPSPSTHVSCLSHVKEELQNGCGKIRIRKITALFLSPV